MNPLVQQFGNLLSGALGRVGQSFGALGRSLTPDPIEHMISSHFGQNLKANIPTQPQKEVVNTKFGAIPYQGPKGLTAHAAEPSPIPTPTPTPSPTMQPTPMPTAQAYGQLTPQMLQQGISKWANGNTGNVPIMQHLQAIAQAGNDFAARGLDPYLPVVMSLRETGGGRDLFIPNANNKPETKGNNNVYNIRNIRDKQGNIIGQPNNPKQFINYPSIETATLGGDNNGEHSGGFEGQIFDNYGAYLKSKAMEDFFNQYSSPSDGNGSLPEQVKNYQFIKDYFK
jgi:hypothetical protein